MAMKGQWPFIPEKRMIEEVRIFIQLLCDLCEVRFSGRVLEIEEPLDMLVQKGQFLNICDECRIMLGNKGVNADFIIQKEVRPLIVR